MHKIKVLFALIAGLLIFGSANAQTRVAPATLNGSTLLSSEDCPLWITGDNRLSVKVDIDISALRIPIAILEWSIILDLPPGLIPVEDECIFCTSSHEAECCTACNGIGSIIQLEDSLYQFSFLGQPCPGRCGTGNCDGGKSGTLMNLAFRMDPSYWASLDEGIYNGTIQLYVSTDESDGIWSCCNRTTIPCDENQRYWVGFAPMNDLEICLQNPEEWPTLVEYTTWGEIKESYR